MLPSGAGQRIILGRMNHPEAGRSSWLVAALSFGVLFLVAYGWPDARRGYTDFLSFYSGARLVGTPDLYSTARANEIQKRFSPKPKEVRAYIRPPAYAVLLWPLGRLPYPQAHALWQLVNIAAVAGFLVLWSPRLPAVLLCCWYFPLWISFALGQDLPLFLLCLAGAADLLRKEKRFAAGLLFALCGVKFHLFILLPLVIAAKQQWKFLAGIVSGGGAMLAISFAVAGWDWPVRYYQLLRVNERLQASQGRMANLKGLFFGLPHLEAWWFAAAATVAVATWYAIRRSDLTVSLALAAAGGLLVSPHAYLPDVALLLPLLLSLAARFGFDQAIPAAVLTGAFSLALALPRLAFVGQLALLLFFGWAVYVVSRGRFRGMEAT